MRMSRHSHNSVNSKKLVAKFRKEKIKKKQKNRRIYVRSIRSCECLCSEFSLAQQKRTKEGLGPVLAGQRGSAHRTDMKMSGFIRQRGRGTGRRWESSALPVHCHAWHCRLTGVVGRAGWKGAGRKGLTSQSWPFIQNVRKCRVSSPPPWMWMCTDVFEDHFVDEVLSVVLNVKGLYGWCSVWLCGFFLGVFFCCLFLQTWSPSTKNVNTVKGFKLHVFFS